MHDTIDILGVHIHKCTMAEAEDRVMGFLSEDRPHMVFTPNSEIIMVARKNPVFLDILNRADLLTADGIGVVYASKILKDPLSERVAGFDLATRLLSRAAESGHTVYFFGGKPGVAEQARDKLTEQYPSLQVIGTQNGYFDDKKEADIIADIQAKQPDFLFVCLGAPKQEQWIAQHADTLGARVLIGLGGGLDVWAGVVERAPEWYQRRGLEWLYRLMKQPSRIGRMMALPKFALTVFFRGKRVKKAGSGAAKEG